MDVEKNTEKSLRQFEILYIILEDLTSTKNENCRKVFRMYIEFFLNTYISLCGLPALECISFQVTRGVNSLCYSKKTIILITIKTEYCSSILLIRKFIKSLNFVIFE